MAAYHYIALNKKGTKEKGVLEADSERQASTLLREKQLMPIEIKPMVERFSRKKGERKSFSWSWNRFVPISDLALMTRQLATLLGAGLPLEESLVALGEQVSKANLKHIVLGVRSKVLEGHTLAYSMGLFPEAFSKLFCATVGSGEQTGHLDIILDRLADYAEQQYAIQSKVKQASIYPAIMLGVAISIVIFLLTFVVPNIISVFTTTGQTLPSITLVLIAMSHFVRNYGLFIVLFLGIGSIVFRYALRKPSIRFMWDSLLLRLPLIGYFTQTLNTARYARTLGILSSAGVSLLEAMQVSSTLITNLPMHRQIAEASNRVKEGSTIHYALKQTQYFSPMSLHLIASGEKSGRLDSMLERAANNQDTEILRLIDTSLSLFEPLIILIMGGIVLFIVLAILLPIFSLNTMGQG